MVQTSRTLLENSDGVYERILQVQKAGERRELEREGNMVFRDGALFIFSPPRNANDRRSNCAEIDTSTQKNFGENSKRVI